MQSNEKMDPGIRIKVMRIRKSAEKSLDRDKNACGFKILAQKIIRVKSHTDYVCCMKLIKFNAVLRSRKYFFRLRGAENSNYCYSSSGSGPRIAIE